MTEETTGRTAHRYAVYFAPAQQSAWWEAGSRWLGRCAVQQKPMHQPPVPDVSPEEQFRLTQAPRRYGWHATLKAPFALAPGADFADLRKRLCELCGTLQAFTLPPLKVTRIDDFLALAPERHSPEIDAVAAACVSSLHPLAATLSINELQRRRAGGLTPMEDALLLRWGYPFVLERFRFHMSLTGSLSETQLSVVDAMRRAGAQWFGPLPACRVESVALFAESRPGADFVLVEHLRLGS